MCLSVDYSATEAMRKKIQKAGKLRCYKMYFVREDGRVVHFYTGTPLKLKKGCDVSNRKSTKITEKYRDGDWDWGRPHGDGTTLIKKGIHVYLHNITKAHYAVALPVIGKAEDFVACNNQHAVFTKVYIDEKKLISAMKRVAIERCQFSEDIVVEIDGKKKVIRSQHVSNI